MENESVAIALWPTPWYLKLIGKPAWRVKTRNIALNPALDTWEWRYYHDIHDYANQHQPPTSPPPMPKIK